MLPRQSCHLLLPARKRLCCSLKCRVRILLWEFSASVAGAVGGGIAEAAFPQVRICGATTRSGRACRRPATLSGRCRMHGGQRHGSRKKESSLEICAAPSTPDDTAPDSDYRPSLERLADLDSNNF